MRVHFGFQSVGARSAAPPGDALKSIRPGDRMRGGRWVPALPTGDSAQTSVGVWGSVKRMRNLPQLARGGQCPPGNPQGSLRIRRHWPLQFMAANGRRKNRRQQVGAGSACPENRRIRELESMVPEFVDRTGGSKWQSALPTGGSAQTSMGVWGSVKRMRNLLQLAPRRAVPARQSAGKPADSQTLAAPIYGGQWSSKEPAAAGGCRLSLPGNPENSGSSIYASRIRRQNRRQQVEPGTARPTGS